MALPARGPNQNVLYGTSGSVRHGGVSVEVDSVRRRPAVPDPGRVQRALSGRTQSSRQDNKLLTRMLPIKPNSEATRLSLASDSEVCSSSMPTPHEFQVRLEPSLGQHAELDEFVRSDFAGPGGAGDLALVVFLEVDLPAGLEFEIVDVQLSREIAFDPNRRDLLLIWHAHGVSFARARSRFLRPDGDVSNEKRTGHEPEDRAQY